MACNFNNYYEAHIQSIEISSSGRTYEYRITNWNLLKKICDILDKENRCKHYQHTTEMDMHFGDSLVPITHFIYILQTDIDLNYLILQLQNIKERKLLIETK